MDCQIKKIENSVIEIALKIEGKEVSDAKKNAIKKIGKDSEISGFRKGHAPESVIESNYEGIIKEEVTDAILKKHYDTILKDNNIQPVDYIKVVKVDIDKDKFKAIFRVEVYPEILLGEYKGVEEAKGTFEITEDILNKEIEMLLSSKSKLDDTADGYKAKLTDTVDLAYHGFVDGVPFDGGKSESHMLKLGSKSFIDTFEDQIVGYEKGQEGDIIVTFPSEYNMPDLAGKEATFKVKINAIKTTSIPELNEEFAKESGFESIEDLKNRKTTEIETREEKKLEGEHRQKVLNKILKKSEIVVPKSMIEREIKGRISEMETQLKSQNMSLDMYLKMSGTTLEKLTDQIKPMAIEKIKLDLILDEISKKEDIKLSYEELTKKTEEVAAMYKMSVEKLKEELKKANNLDKFMTNLKIDATIEKTVNFIMSEVK